MNPRLKNLLRRGHVAHVQEREKMHKYEAVSKPHDFLPAVAEAFGHIGPKFSLLLSTIAEVSTYQSKKDLDLSAVKHQSIAGAQLGLLYGRVSVTLQRALATQIRQIAENWIVEKGFRRRREASPTHCADPS